MNGSLATAMRSMDRDGTRISLMAERAGISKQAMGVSVRELETMGLVTIAVDPNDRRARIVRYTNEGEAMVERFISADQHVERALRADLGYEVIDRLKRDSKRLLLSNQPAP